MIVVDICCIQDLLYMSRGGDFPPEGVMAVRSALGDIWYM